MNKINEQDKNKIDSLLISQVYTLQDMVQYFEGKYTGNQIKYYINKNHKLKPKRESSRGNVALVSVLKKLFPTINVQQEYHVGESLRLDAFLPFPYNIGFEYDGVQHTRYIPGLHKNEEDFILGQERDKRKQTLCDGRGINLIRFDHETEITEDLILSSIEETGYGSGIIKEEFSTNKEKLKIKQNMVKNKKKEYNIKYKQSEFYLSQKEKQKEYRKKQYEKQKEFARKYRSERRASQSS